MIFPQTASFTYPDSFPLCTLGNTETGQVWQYTQHPVDPTVKWGIKDGQALIIQNTFTNTLGAYVETFASDGTVEVDAPNTAWSGGVSAGGIAFRYSDPLNGWVVIHVTGNYYLVKIIAGAGWTVAITPYVDGTKLQAVLSGSNIEIYRDATLLFSTVDSFNVTATNHGLGAYYFDTIGVRWNNFKFTNTSSITTVTDQFNRADNPSLKTTDQGTPWVYDEGIWMIKDQQAQEWYWKDPIYKTFVTIESGTNNIDETVTMAHVGTASGLCWRYKDPSKVWVVAYDSGTTQFALVAVGDAVEYKGSYVITANDGDKIRVKVVDDQLDIYIYQTPLFAEVHMFSFVSTYLQTETKHGLYGGIDAVYYVTDARWDDYILDLSYPVITGIISYFLDRAIVEWDTLVPCTNNTVYYSFNDLTYTLSNVDYRDDPYHHKVTILFPPNAAFPGVINYKTNSTVLNPDGSLGPTAEALGPSPIIVPIETFVLTSTVVSTKTATLTFLSNWAGDIRVEFNPTPMTTGRVYYKNEYLFMHTVILEGLQENTTYDFSASSRLPNGSWFAPAITGSFTTMLNADLQPKQPTEVYSVTRQNHKVLRWKPVTETIGDVRNGISPTPILPSYEIYRGVKSNGKDMVLIDTIPHADINGRKNNVFVDYAQRNDILYYKVVAVSGGYRSLPSEIAVDIGFSNIGDVIGESFMQDFSTFDTAKFNNGAFGK